MHCRGLVLSDIFVSGTPEGFLTFFEGLVPDYHEVTNLA